MVTSHPYNTWPLHIKLFTKEADKTWREVNKNSRAVPLPPGFTSTTELEGVDGKSGQVGSGREGPINVTDGNLFRLRQGIIVDSSPHAQNSSHWPI